jgi:hypothetical protein
VSRRRVEEENRTSPAFQKFHVTREGVRGRRVSIMIWNQEELSGTDSSKLHRIHPHEGTSMSGTTCLILRHAVQKQYLLFFLGSIHFRRRVCVKPEKPKLLTRTCPPFFLTYPNQMHLRLNDILLSLNGYSIFSLIDDILARGEWPGEDERIKLLQEGITRDAVDICTRL